jgi:hypothetical protein
VHSSCKSSCALRIHEGNCFPGHNLAPEPLDSSSQHSPSITGEASTSKAMHCCTRRRAVADACSETTVIATDGKASPWAAMWRASSEIEIAKKRPLASAKLSRCVVPAGLKIMVDRGQTECAEVSPLRGAWAEEVIWKNAAGSDESRLHRSELRRKDILSRSPY